MKTSGGVLTYEETDSSRVHKIDTLLVVAFCFGFTAVSQRRQEWAAWVDAKRMKEKCSKTLLSGRLVNTASGHDSPTPLFHLYIHHVYE